jgi:hypothetical protein
MLQRQASCVGPGNGHQTHFFVTNPKFRTLRASFVSPSSRLPQSPEGMARSPSKEEEEDATAGSGCWRGQPCFAVGDDVEVRLDEDGFRGAHYEATVVARLPGSGGYEVVLATLLACRGGPPLRENVAATNMRPRPPRRPPGRMFKALDFVEAYHREGWWPGVVSAVRRGRKPRYSVTFPLFREGVGLPTSLVRRRRNFVCGTWIDAQEVVSVIISFNTISDGPLSIWF